MRLATTKHNRQTALLASQGSGSSQSPRYWAHQNYIGVMCDANISGHAAKVEADIAEAIKRHGLRTKWTARSLALHTQAVLQGAFILAKAKGDAAVARESIDHLRRYIEHLFQPARRKAI